VLCGCKTKDTAVRVTNQNSPGPKVGNAVGARAALKVVLTRQGISSQLVDNLNVSTHLRALLTDLFLLDEAVKGLR